MEQAAGAQDNRLETIVAILIALTTVIGAVVAWRASVSADGAGDADFAGLRAATNAEETRALNYVNVYEHYRAFSEYKRHNDLGDLIAEAQANATEEEAAFLERDRADAFDIATAKQQLFPNRFRNRDGTYSIQREMGELWADAAKEKDLNPEPQFAEADALRLKTNNLFVALTILGVSLVAYTLVEVAGRRLQYPLIAIGTLLLIAGTGMSLYLELAGG